MYILGPDGSSYGYTNDHDPSNIQACINGALKRYREHPPKAATVSQKEIETPFAITPPASASVIRVYSRIRPLPKGCTGLNQSVGRDFLWVYVHEARAMLAPGRQPFKLPASLALRMARYHLLDNVRGTPDMWDANEVKKATFVARIVKEAGGVRTVGFEGRFVMKTRSERKGYAGKVVGQFDIRTSDARITRFRAYSDGLAWGNGTYTPNAPKSRYHLVIAMIEATDPMARIVPPEAVSTENSDAKYHHP